MLCEILSSSCWCLSAVETLVERYDMSNIGEQLCHSSIFVSLNILFCFEVRHITCRFMLSLNKTDLFSKNGSPISKVFIFILHVLQNVTKFASLKCFMFKPTKPTAFLVSFRSSYCALKYSKAQWAKWKPLQLFFLSFSLIYLSFSVFD